MEVYNPNIFYATRMIEPWESMHPLRLDSDGILCWSGDKKYAPLAADVRVFQAGLFQNLTREFPAYGTYFHGIYYVNLRMGEVEEVLVEFVNHSDYSIKIGLSFQKDPRDRIARVHTHYDFTGAGEANPVNEEFTVCRRNMLIGVTGELSNIVGEMSVGTTFVTEGGIDFFGSPGDCLSSRYESIQVSRLQPHGYEQVYSQVGYRRI